MRGARRQAKLAGERPLDATVSLGPRTTAFAHREPLLAFVSRSANTLGRGNTEAPRLATNLLTMPLRVWMHSRELGYFAVHPAFGQMTNQLTTLLLVFSSAIFPLAGAQ